MLLFKIIASQQLNKSNYGKKESVASWQKFSRQPFIG